MRPRLVCLGDSTSCGEGVGLRVPAGQTWPARVAAALDGDLVPLAAPGARVRDVLALQVPQAVALRAEVATLLVGLNDVSRGGFDPDRFARELRQAVDRLAAVTGCVLLGRLHDPAALLPLPPPLRRAVRERAAQVNAAVDEAAAAHPDRVAVLDLAAVPGLRLRRAWDVDRLHPGPGGHALLAEAAVAVLRRCGAAVRPVEPPPLPPAPGLAREARWALRSGLPWLAGHLPQVVLPALAAGVRPRYPARTVRPDPAGRTVRAG